MSEYGGDYSSGGGIDWGRFSTSSAGNAGRAGFFTSLSQMLSHTGRKAAKLRRSYQRQLAQEAVNHAVRGREELIDKSGRDEQYLDQSLAGRGLMNSSIATEDKAYFGRARQRALDEADANVNMAMKNKDVQKWEMRVNQLSRYSGMVDSLIGIAGGAVSGAG